LASCLRRLPSIVWRTSQGVKRCIRQIIALSTPTRMSKRPALIPASSRSATRSAVKMRELPSIAHVSAGLIVFS